MKSINEKTETKKNGLSKACHTLVDILDELGGRWHNLDEIESSASVIKFHIDQYELNEFQLHFMISILTDSLSDKKKSKLSRQLQELCYESDPIPDTDIDFSEIDSHIQF